VKPFRIAVIPGDGIGKEVVPVAVDLLRAATVGEPRGLEFVDFPWGCDYYLASGRMMPEDALETLRAFDAIFLGAIGDPARVPDHVSLWGLLLAIRRGFHESLNLRPARYMEGLPSPLRDATGLDVLVVRENSEGEYSRIGGLLGDGADEQAFQVNVFTRRASERAMRYAFEAARGRRRHVTCATKSNAIEHTMPFWDRVFREVAADYPDVETRLIHIDALAARLVTAPASVDVIVASNLFGDILTDLSAALMGSIGVAPAANIDPDSANPPNPPMFEPVHGSAPDIAGRGIANPIGQAWTGVLLLDHLGLRGPAERLMAAIEGAVAAGEVTPDLGGRLSTVEAGEAIGTRLGGTVEQSASA
jgi:tartrate dehydrogenase/decarboxylase/D-malate dehydrogenase